MTTEKLTLLIDAQHLLVNIDRYFEEAARMEMRGSDIRKPDAEEVARTFWMIVSVTIGLILKSDYGHCYENDGRLSCFIFDAVYEGGNENITSSTVRFLRPEDKDYFIRRKTISQRIYSLIPAFQGDDLWSPPIDMDRPSSLLDVQFFTATPEAIHSFEEVPVSPGIYKGFLSKDSRVNNGISQKVVDSMITLCGAIKANEGRNVALISSDSDFLPLASYVLSKGLKFVLIHAGPISKKWKILDGNSRFQTREAPGGVMQRDH